MEFRRNVFTDIDGKVLVSKVKASQNLEESIEKAVNFIGGFSKAFSSSDEVIIKPNYNSDDPFPASSDPEFVRSVINLLYKHGVSKIVIMESSGLPWLPTEKVLEKMSLARVAKECGVELIVFDKKKWIKTSIPGKYWKKILLPTDLLKKENAKMVWLPCMKTHRYARFSLSLKLAVGFLGFRQRTSLHLRHLEEKIAEINLAVHPDLIIMDGRKCFVSGGPDKGQVEEPNVILASGDRVAIDVEALKILKSYKANNRLDMDPWKFKQIQHAIELGLGVKSEDEMRVISDYQ